MGEIVLSKGIYVTIQARMTSSRLPGKVLANAVGKSILELMIERLKRIPSVEGIIMATTTNREDDPVVELSERLGILHYRGDEHDVMARVLEAAEAHNVKVIVETTGDNPLMDPDVIEESIQAYLETGVDYLANNLERSYPIGMDTKVFSTAVLADAISRTDDPEEHEHVSLFIYRHPELYKIKNVTAPERFFDPELRLTLDTEDDLKLIRVVFEALYPDNPEFGLADILELIGKNPELRAINSDVEQRWVTY